MHAHNNNKCILGIHLKEYVSILLSCQHIHDYSYTTCNNQGMYPRLDFYALANNETEVYIHTVLFYSVRKSNEVLPTVKWMEREKLTYTTLRNTRTFSQS